MRDTKDEYERLIDRLRSCVDVEIEEGLREDVAINLVLENGIESLNDQACIVAHALETGLAQWAAEISWPDIKSMLYDDIMGDC